MRTKSQNIEQDHSERYSNYKAWNNEKFYAIKVFKNILKLKNIKKYLDIGCADGSFAKKIKDSMNVEAYGIDVSKKAITKAKQKGIIARYHNVSNKLPYNSNYFNLITSCEVIEHVYDTDFLLIEINRCLKKKGIFIITTPNLTSLPNRIKILFGKYPNYVPEYKMGGAGHIRAYTSEVLQKQLKDNNFDIIRVLSPNIPFPMISPNISLIFKQIAIKLGDYIPTFGSHLIIIARKK
jgi:2-polyprenyl-3-methyl-5-hydroxy-6-metoxy-1,4-benzoquinol methylase